MRDGVYPKVKPGDTLTWRIHPVAQQAGYYVNGTYLGDILGLPDCSMHVRFMLDPGTTIRLISFNRRPEFGALLRQCCNLSEHVGWLAFNETVACGFASLHWPIHGLRRAVFGTADSIRPPARTAFGFRPRARLVPPAGRPDAVPGGAGADSPRLSTETECRAAALFLLHGFRNCVCMATVGPGAHCVLSKGHAIVLLDSFRVGRRCGSGYRRGALHSSRDTPGYRVKMSC